MLKTVIFDLDGTLLPMNEEEFTKNYFYLLAKRLIPHGYEKDELINGVWTGTKAMIKNDGTKTNLEVFWNTHETIFGKDKLKDKAEFDKFYTEEFKQTIVTTKPNNSIREIIDYIKNKNLKLILASNPVFPKNGMLTRMGFAGLNENDFDYISSYEDSHFSKPNPKFYEEVLKNNNLKNDEVIYFGNSEKEDYIPATACGIETYLVGDCVTLENKNLKVYKLEDIKTIIDSKM